MVNLLVIIPEMNERYIPSAFPYIYMKEKFNVNIEIICSRLRTGKGTGLDPKYEIMSGIPVHRLFYSFNEQKHRINEKIEDIRAIVSNLKPDAIVCSQQGNLPLSVTLKKEFDIPIILICELAYDFNKPYDFFESTWLRRMGKIVKINSLGILLGELYWIWLSSHVSSIITSNYNDIKNFKYLSRHGTEIGYIPWPSMEVNKIKNSYKNRKRAIFVGALATHKNLEECLLTVPKLLEETETEEFIFVGGGKYQYIVDELMNRYPNNIYHFKSLPRDLVLNLIATCFYSYSPCKEGGWGFITDSWAMKTPLLVTSNHFDFNDKKDCILSAPSKIVKRINDLYNSEEYYINLVESGYVRYKEQHSPKIIGKKYYDVIKKVL